jgi:hypothetical protein
MSRGCRHEPEEFEIYEDAVDSCDTVIEFTDGTSFPSCFSYQTTVKGTLFKGGLGTPLVIRDYEL